jgi:hypothetical protein
VATFNKSLKNIADYLQLNCGIDVSKAICNMTPAYIFFPDIPQPKPDPNKPGDLIPVSKNQHIPLEASSHRGK